MRDNTTVCTFDGGIFSVGRSVPMSKPRRAGQRWREGAPAYVLDCFDNGGKTVDRYTVMLWTAELGEDCVGFLGMSDAPTHPQGFSQWGELSRHHAAAWRFKSKGERVRWLDLPVEIREHVKGRWEG